MSRSRCSGTSSPGAEPEFRGLMGPPGTDALAGDGGGSFPPTLQMLWPGVSRRADPKAAPWEQQMGE